MKEYIHNILIIVPLAFIATFITGNEFIGIGMTIGAIIYNQLSMKFDLDNLNKKYLNKK